MEGLRMPARILRSDRSTIAIRITDAGEIEVLCPRTATEKELQQVLDRHSRWIQKQVQKVKTMGTKGSPFSEEEIQCMIRLAKKIIPQKAAYFAARLGVTYGRIAIRRQHTKWGSCSSKGNLNFNCTLMKAPEPVLDYVVVHELCHRLEMNHSPAFWKLVEGMIPDHKARRQWLNDHGNELIGRLPR